MSFKWISFVSEAKETQRITQNGQSITEFITRPDKCHSSLRHPNFYKKILKR